ncbi:hypothetical protein EPNKCIFM_00021 [Klebsiella phage KP13-16]|nr:hypothetical protein EPNKCIFM_00021 [Klebsiella phage KP13-16]
MKVGDRVKCTRSTSTHNIYTLNDIYIIEGFSNGGMLLRDNNGDLDKIPIPMNGSVWGFKLVDEEKETEALIKLLEISQEDVVSGKTMTGEQLMQELSHKGLK